MYLLLTLFTIRNYFIDLHRGILDVRRLFVECGKILGYFNFLWKCFIVTSRSGFLCLSVEEVCCWTWFCDWSAGCGDDEDEESNIVLSVLSDTKSRESNSSPWTWLALSLLVSLALRLLPQQTTVYMMALTTTDSSPHKHWKERRCLRKESWLWSFFIHA